MPSLENLRKQAKLILRWHRERYYPVAAQIRAVLPRFAGLSDPEILAHEFKLSDAQEMVARQAGFENWKALKSGIATMPETAAKTIADRPVISETAAQLFVADIKASCDFFVEKLGFSIVFVYGEPPFYAQVKRDRGFINLRCVDRPVIDPELRDRESLLSSDMGLNTAEEIKQLYLEFQAKGVTFDQPLRREPWGARTFIVKDPDGNLLLFAGPAE
jgi:catechol 2,3-dioxygenase-like lactoylglutathione lyase family enzyme